MLELYFACVQFTTQNWGGNWIYYSHNTEFRGAYSRYALVTQVRFIFPVEMDKQRWIFWSLAVLLTRGCSPNYGFSTKCLFDLLCLFFGDPGSSLHWIMKGTCPTWASHLLSISLCQCELPCGVVVREDISDSSLKNTCDTTVPNN